MKKYIIGISIFALALFCFNYKVIAQSFMPLYGRSLQFEQPGKGSVLLQTGVTSRAGLSTVTIPDYTGTVATTASTGISATNIACWTSTGQLGKCTTSISGVNCTSCT